MSERPSISFVRLPTLLMAVAVLAVLAFQLPWISRPPFDAHAFRQAQTLATIELFARDGIDLLRPKTNYVGEPGVFVLELSLFQAWCALLYQWFGPHVWLVRASNLVVTLANAALTFAIARRLFDRKTGWGAALLYLLAPLNLLYATCTLIDPSATCVSLVTFLFALRIVRSAEDRTAWLDWAVFLIAATITALIKALYLFPTCILLATTFLEKRRLTLRLFGAGLCLVFAGIVFFFWLRYAQRVNDASPFTRGVSATTLLGFEPLATRDFYNYLARRLLIHLIGPGGALLAIGAVLLACRKRGATGGARAALLMLAVAVLVYYPAFARAHVHDYYSLVIVPYAAILAGFGAMRLANGLAAWIPSVRVASPALVAAFAALLSCVVFLKPFLLGPRPRLSPGPEWLELQRLSAGQFERWSFGMVFVAPDPRLPVPTNLGTDIPEGLYAAGLRGTGHLVASSDAALALWREKRPHYRNLKYVVFFGLEPPLEIVRACGEVIARDEQQKFFACRVR